MIEFKSNYLALMFDSTNQITLLTPQHRFQSLSEVFRKEDISIIILFPMMIIRGFGHVLRRSIGRCVEIHISAFGTSEVLNR